MSIFSLRRQGHTIILFGLLIFFPLLSNELKDDQWDKRKLRNNYTYLVEGKGGLGVLLGETEEMIFKILGQPTRRSYGTLDLLYFHRRTCQGTVSLFKGRISRIRFNVEYGQSESLKWKTALGLTQQMIEPLNKEDAIKFILDFYKNPVHLLKSDTLLIHSLGILFKWSGEKMVYIEIFKPWPEYPLP